MFSAPQFGPVHACVARVQQEGSPEDQWNCTWTRPYLSGSISSPSLPTTIAVCGPGMRGQGVRRGGRKVSPVGIAVKPHS